MNFKTTLLITIIFFTSNHLKSQDVIIKNDKAEIKSKVTEITENLIKYKKWENADGPTYNINKADVFMIIYANGQREIIKQISTPTSGYLSQNPSIISTDKKATGLAEQILESSGSFVDTIVNYQNVRLKYKPSRINVGFNTPISVGLDKEFRVVKNIFNIGLTYNYIFSEDQYILASNFAFLYGSVYAPVNRLVGNYVNQDKGLFVFGHAGYGVTYVQTMDFFGNTQSQTSTGFTWRLGADYFITRGFGISVSSFEMKSFYGGLIFNF